MYYDNICLFRRKRFGDLHDFFYLSVDNVFP